MVRLWQLGTADLHCSPHKRNHPRDYVKPVWAVVCGGAIELTVEKGVAWNAELILIIDEFQLHWVGSLGVPLDDVDVSISINTEVMHVFEGFGLLLHPLHFAIDVNRSGPSGA